MSHFMDFLVNGSHNSVEAGTRKELIQYRSVTDISGAEELKFQLTLAVNHTYIVVSGEVQVYS